MLTLSYTTAAIIGIAVTCVILLLCFYAVLKESENNSLRSQADKLRRENERLRKNAPIIGYDAALDTYYITDDWRDLA